ncbi:MAG TPA: M1 family aminopeptidase [Longimicrobiales bacterium]
MMVAMHRVSRILGAALLFVLPAVAAAQHAPQDGADASIFRPLDLPAPNRLRTAGGAPGPDYWQQRADYRIEATLDPATTTVTGSETVRYHNNSPHTLRFVWLQVDQNLYRPGSRGSFVSPAESRWGARGFEGGMEIRYARADGTEVEPYIYDTMMRLDLPRPLPPGGTIDLSIGWSFPVPEHGSDRMARQGDLYEIAQWFPRMAVYDDISGWNTDPYLGQGEFYLEYGDYDVALTVPAGYTVAATGTLQNPEVVLTPEQRERLAEAARSGEQVAIIRADEVGTRKAHPADEGMLTWRFHAENVHDFAWAASPDFRWDATSWDGILCNAYYQEDAAAWRTAADMTCFSIREFSERWYHYPYPQATSVAGPVGGMEYPMFVMVHAGGDEPTVFSTIAHEHGHEWFPMIVGSNERRYTWMDEGFNTFIDAWANDLRYPGTDAKAAYVQQYMAFSSEGREQPIMTPPDRVQRALLGLVGYRKPAMALNLLRDEVLGPEAFDAAFREYIRRWAFKHPQPADFFRTIEEVSGHDLDWFWRGWFYTTHTLDQAVDSVTQQRDGDGVVATIHLSNRTPLVMPLDLRLTLAGGETRDIALPVEIWYNGNTYAYPVALPAGVVRVEVDPDHAMPDQDRENNVWARARS